jgi:hypothetical protein
MIGDGLRYAFDAGFRRSIWRRRDVIRRLFGLASWDPYGGLTRLRRASKAAAALLARLDRGGDGDSRRDSALDGAPRISDNARKV